MNIVNENFVQPKDIVYKCKASLTCQTLPVFQTVYCRIKPIVAHGVKADRLS